MKIQRPIRKPRCRKILVNGQRCKNSAHGTLALYCTLHAKMEARDAGR